jgi:hypothetical protein
MPYSLQFTRDNLEDVSPYSRRDPNNTWRAQQCAGAGLNRLVCPTGCLAPQGPAMMERWK